MFQDHAFLSRRAFVQASAASFAAFPVGFGLGESLAIGAAENSVARYIIERLAKQRADILFGVPGATCDPLFMAAAADPGMDIVVTASDLEAGYAADGFARARGLAALSLTYGVGTLSAISVVAGAYAERSPIVVINGGPNRTDLKLQRKHRTYFSHSTGREQSDWVMFREVTAMATRIDRIDEAPAKIDRAIATALREKRPVYIEVAKDLWRKPCGTPGEKLAPATEPSGNEAQHAASIVSRLKTAKRPLVFLGVEIQRFGLEAEAKSLIAKLGTPYATTMLAKSVLTESTPHFAGVYAGVNSIPSTRALVEKSDFVLALGCVFGRQYRRLATHAAKKGIVANDGEFRSGGPKATPCSLGDLIRALLTTRYQANPTHSTTNPLNGLSFESRRRSVPNTTRPKETIGVPYDRILALVSEHLDANHAVLTDTSLSMYPAADLNVPSAGAFFCNGVWQSIGFSAGAAVGVALATGKRPVVLCGDGGFQMTAQALSTMVRAGLKAVVIVLDNGHYGIEQYLLDSSYFADDSPGLPHLGLNRWDYPAFARALGFKDARAIRRPEELKQALVDSRQATGPMLLSVTIPPKDLPRQLRK